MNKANECTCPSGDGSLVHPCPAHPAVEQAGANVGHGHVLPRADGVKMRCGGPGLCSECTADAYRARAALAQPSPAHPAPVEQAGGDERDFQAKGAQEVPSPVSKEYDRHLIGLLRKGEALPGHQEEAADEIERLRDWNDHLNNTVLPNILNPNFLMLMKGGERLLDLCTKDGKFIGVSLNDMKDVFDWMVTHARIAPDHAALAQPSPKCATCNGSGQVWISDEPQRHFEDCPDCAQPSLAPTEGFSHFPELLESVQQMDAMLKAEGAQEERKLSDLGNELHNLSCAVIHTNEDWAGQISSIAGELWKWPDRAALAQPSPAQAEQAEAERPEVVAVMESNGAGGKRLAQRFPIVNVFVGDELMTVAQHGRIVEARWNRAMDLMGEHVARISEKFKAERDDALARVAELERQQPVAWMHDQPNRVDVIHRDVKDLLQRVPGSSRGIHRPLDVSEHYTIPLYAAPVAQAQHSVPEGWVQSLPLKDHQPCKPNEDRANGYTIPIYSRPVLVEEALRKLRAVLCDPIGNVVIDGSDGDREEVQRALGMLAAAPGKEVPQAWLDVQAERRRQVEAEGWTPEHDDLYCAAELPRAAAAYILNGANDEAPAIWPFSAKWWKPRDARSNYVRASALILAEIERLDRAAAAGKEVGHE
ncbi:hypothetical protein NR640_006635 [Pseudomonas aeruginosa]